MSYSSVAETIFTGNTGRELRNHPPEVREVQFYLVSGPDRDPFGVFLFDPEMAAPRLGKGRTGKKVREAVAVLEDLGFCRYDDQTQWIWILEMARHQFLTPLKATDYRCTTAKRWYRGLQRNPWMALWFDRYVDDFHLNKEPHAVERREWVDRERGIDAPPPSPIEGASMPRSMVCTDQDLLGVRPTKTEIPVLVDPHAKLKGAEIDAAFDRVWAVYPKAVERKQARAEFGRLKPTLALVDRMVEAITLQSQQYDWQKDNGKYVPKLVNWLANGRWDDKVDAPRPALAEKTVRTFNAAQSFIERRRAGGPHG